MTRVRFRWRGKTYRFRGWRRGKKLAAERSKVVDLMAYRERRLAAEGPKDAA